MVVGVLALQGGVEEHVAVLKMLGSSHRLIRKPSHLSGCSHLLLPGGESTTLSMLLEKSGLDRAIQRFQGRILGTCAGAILLARKAGSIRTLGLIDCDIERNAYGPQTESFEASLKLRGKRCRCAFIRAPMMRRVGPDVEVLVELEGKPIIVRQGRIVAATCHPEVVGETALHRLFLAD